MKEVIEAANELINNYSETDDDGNISFVNPDRGWDRLLTALEELYVAIDEAYPPSGYVATRGLQHEG